MKLALSDIFLIFVKVFISHTVYLGNHLFKLHSNDPSLSLSLSQSLCLLISGSDSRIKLWDLESGYNTLVNFEMVRLQTSKAIQLAISQDSAHVFVPCMSVVKVKYSFYVIVFNFMSIVHIHDHIILATFTA